MCRTTFKHYMHHDVRTPVVLNVDDGGEDASLYAHPWRTSTHTCNIDIGHSFKHLGICIDAESGRPRLCEYHSCCVCHVVVERCAAASCGDASADAGEEDLPEPEECDHFVLEHRHGRLGFQEPIWNQWAQVRDQILGLPSAASAPDGQQEQQQQQRPRQPEWRELSEVSVSHNWRPVYRRGDIPHAIKWTGWMLDLMAQLHVLREEDVCAFDEVQEHGLAPGGFAPMDRMAITSENVRKHEKFIRDELEWAATPPP